MESTRTQSFREALEASGPDVARATDPRPSLYPVVALPLPQSGPASGPSFMERLEARFLYAVDAQVVSNVLVVTGSSAGERIDVYETNGVNNDVISVKFDSGAPYNFLDNQFTSIKVLAGAGADTIVFGNRTGGLGDESVKFPALIYGEDGNDSVSSATDGNDTIYGGYGNDLLEGEDGNDKIFGGFGTGVSSDTPGNDVLHGGDGADSLYGEGGDDSLVAGLGSDYLYGGDGNDTLKADDGTGETDTLDGGFGTDSGWWDVGTDSTISMEGRFL